MRVHQRKEKRQPNPLEAEHRLNVPPPVLPSKSPWSAEYVWDCSRTCATEDAAGYSLKCHPTIEGRKLLLQMNVAGGTQYLAQVQRMPTAIEKRISKRIRKYAWGDQEKAPVSQAMLRVPKEEGG
ncbi:hypothetical protein C8F01DRAFT_994889, partial [Mycena amicta]